MRETKKKKWEERCRRRAKKGGDKGSKDIKGNNRECWTKR